MPTRRYLLQLPLAMTASAFHRDVCTRGGEAAYRQGRVSKGASETPFWMFHLRVNVTVS